MRDSNKQRELDRRQREADWKAVLATPEGARVLGYLLAESGYHGIFYGGPDTHFTAYHEGRRAMGQFIVRQVQIAAPDALSTIILRGLINESGRDGGNRGGSDDTTDE